MGLIEAVRVGLTGARTVSYSQVGRQRFALLVAKIRAETSTVDWRRAFISA